MSGNRWLRCEINTQRCPRGQLFESGFYKIDAPEKPIRFDIAPKKIGEKRGEY